MPFSGISRLRSEKAASGGGWTRQFGWNRMLGTGNTRETATNEFKSSDILHHNLKFVCRFLSGTLKILKNVLFLKPRCVGLENVSITVSKTAFMSEPMIN